MGPNQGAARRGGGAGREPLMRRYGSEGESWVATPSFAIRGRRSGRVEKFRVASDFRAAGRNVDVTHYGWIPRWRPPEHGPSRRRRRNLPLPPTCGRRMSASCLDRRQPIPGPPPGRARQSRRRRQVVRTPTSFVAWRTPILGGVGQEGISRPNRPARRSPWRIMCVCG